MQSQMIAGALGGAPAAPRRIAAAAASRGARRAVIVAQQAGEVPVTFRVHKKVKPLVDRSVMETTALVNSRQAGPRLLLSA